MATRLLIPTAGIAAWWIFESLWLGIAFSVVALWAHWLKESVHSVDPTPSRSMAEEVEPPSVQPMYQVPLLIHEGRYETARRVIRSVAPQIRHETQAVRQTYHDLVRMLSLHDPLYEQAMQAVLPLVQRWPGMTQADAHYAVSVVSKEDLDCILLMAHELGRLQRVQRGHQMLLFPFGSVPSGR